MKILFVKIGGVGMLPCALLAKELGHEVIGLDLPLYPPASNIIRDTHIPFFSLEEFSFQDLKNFDLIVVGNSLAKDHPLAQYLIQQDVPYLSFPRFLKQYILDHREVIGLAGTHGKSSSSYFMVQMLEQLGFNPGYLIGAQLPDRASAKLGKDFFVLECDEYDSAFFEKIPKVRVYEPDHMILTSLEFDHADIFKNLEEIENHFRLLPKKGLIVQHESLLNKNIFSKETLTYVFKNSFIDNMPDHYQENILGCLTLLKGLGLKTDQLDLSKIMRPSKRQEFKGYYKNLKVISDFAHHPTAVRKTLQSFLLLEKSPHHVIYCPESYTSRSNLFFEEYLSIFLKEFKVNSLLLVHNQSLKTDLNFSLLQKKISNMTIAKSLEDILSYIEEKSTLEGSLLIMDNRSCYGLWTSSFVQSLCR